MRIWLIVGIGLLAGCESEFERCVSTELPIAYESVGIEDELAAGEALLLVEDYLEFYEGTKSEFGKWVEKNSPPEQEEGQDIESFIESDLSKWIDKMNAEGFRLAQDFGLPVNSVDEYVELQDTWSNAVSRYIEPRSANAGCTTDACNEMSNIERLKIQLEEARAFHEKELKRFEPDARRIAGRVCNSHGIYE